MRKASTKMLEQGIQRHPLLQTSSPLKPKHQSRTNIEIGTANGGHFSMILKCREL